jgi:hypothetical protein
MRRIVTISLRGVGVESSERVSMKLDREWRRRILRYWFDKLCDLCRVGHGLQPAGKRLDGSVRTNADNNKNDAAHSETPCHFEGKTGAKSSVGGHSVDLAAVEGRSPRTGHTPEQRCQGRLQEVRCVRDVRM